MDPTSSRWVARAPLVRPPRAGGIALTVIVGVLIAASPAPAATTIGSDLGSSGDILLDCPTTDPCTAAQTALPGRQVTSPIDGVIVRWRVGDGTGSMSLRVLRSAAGGTFTGVARSDAATPPVGPSDVGQPPTISTFPTRIPIRAGDFIGLDLATADSAVGQRTAGGANIVAFVPALADNETRAPDATLSDIEGLLNADVEADADRDGFGDETQDLCAKDATTQGLCGGPCSNDRIGTESNDTLNGTDAGDNIRALGGDDVVTSLNGDDCLFGGTGADRLTGDAGNDTLTGEAGDDVLAGGLGDDSLDAGTENDRADGGVGTDRLAGGVGNDALTGGLGNDTVAGGDGNDELLGSEGDDTIGGGAGNDRLTAGPGRDTLSGGAGLDHLNGVSGNDRLTGGAGNDVMGGGSNNDVLSGGSGNDSMRGDAGNDRLTGSTGNDRIDVGKGRNRASGGPGRDRITAANAKRDRISCGSGRDRVLADATDRVARDCERVKRTEG